MDVFVCVINPLLMPYRVNLPFVLLLFTITQDAVVVTIWKHIAREAGAIRIRATRLHGDAGDTVFTVVAVSAVGLLEKADK